MPQVLWLLLSPALLIFSHSHLALPISTAAVSTSMASPPTRAPPSPDYCPSKCGSIDIPYPFGIGADCAWPGGGNFSIVCNHSYSPPKPYTNENVEIASISLETGEMHVYAWIAFVCYNSSDTIENSDEGQFGLSLDPPLLISPTENVFTAIGCDTLAFLQGGSNYFTGCISYCPSLKDSALDGDPCTGLGCCQSSIPGNLSMIGVGWNTDKNTQANNSAWKYSPCSFAFVSYKHWYNFSRQDLKGKGKHSFTSRVGDQSAPLVLDWAIRGNGSCEMEPVKLTAPACASANSYCEDLNATQGGGYLCKCSEGYMGNPYIVNGCTNIDECELRKSNPAKYEKLYPCGDYTICQDMPGDYKCKCKFGHKGNGKSEKGCQPIFPSYAIAIVATFLSVVLACLAFGLFIKRKQTKLFLKNGGDILKTMGINIFTKKKLKEITNNYSTEIGKGHFSVVYKGTINSTHAQQVAVKCTHEKKVARLRQNMLRPDAPRHEQEEFWKNGFIAEITFQFQTKHPNVVRLVGCCLETDVPILVFEFVSNGSLHDALHGANKPCTLSLLKRLDIAIGSAEALSHMHSHADFIHIHGDVKPANILLDNELKPKVSDFGSSKLLSLNTYTRNVASDVAYIDPVYFKTDRFTAKSDVYSFGVVLLELITGKVAMYGEKFLTMDFEKSYKVHGNGREMYDAEILSHDHASSHSYMECLDMVGALVIRCLNGDADERPTMAQVVEELNKVKLMACEGPCSDAS